MGGDALLFHRALGLGAVRFALSAVSGAAVLAVGAVVLSRLRLADPRAPDRWLLVWVRFSAIAGGGVLGGVVFGALVRGFSVEAAVASAGALALVLIGERFPEEVRVRP